ncbi:MAG TPA: FkbM family methyltransferase [Thermoanaerobaculia bacterium]|nr:FkbM family methyltransferase [Thermoanaerobaculia bacterium]
MLKTLRAIHRRLGIKYRVGRALGYVGRFGLRGAWRAHSTIWRSSGVREITIPGVRHPVAVRTGTADASTFEHIFVWNDYALDYPDHVRTIVDAGANIGLAAVFFANRFPDATIFAIEPQQDNFELLQKNAAPYPRVVPMHAALWSDDTTLRLSNPDDRVDSYRYDPHSAGDAVPAYRVDTILRRYGLERADVLKIDIEGGETAVFRDATAWIDRVRMIIAELHGLEAEDTFASATADLRATRYRRGENHIIRVDGVG